MLQDTHKWEQTLVVDGVPVKFSLASEGKKVSIACPSCIA